MDRIASSIPQQISTFARVALGLAFFVFGLNGFFHFLPQPPLPEAAVPFISGLAQSGYLFPVLKATEVAAGAMLLSGFLVPLALTLLAPIVVNIALYHVFLAPSPAVVVLLLALEIYLAWSYRDAFRSVLKLRTAPRPAWRTGGGRALYPATDRA